MSLFGFGKRPSHKKFEYIPRYYDPVKEDLEHRLSRYNNKGNNEEHDIEKTKARIRNMFAKPSRSAVRYDERSAYRKAMRRSNKIIFFTLLFLIALMSYFIIIYLPQFIVLFDS